MTLAEMIRDFSLDRVHASPSVFDPEKLLWMNSKYLASMPASELLGRFPSAAAKLDASVAARAIELHRERSRTILELENALAGYAADPDDYDPAGLKKNVGPETIALLSALAARFDALPDSSKESLEGALRELAAEKEVPAGKLIHPLRLAATGKTVGAPLFDVLELLGREAVGRRIGAFVRAVSARTAEPVP
jgi:glutamyl-tRNA synthetase